MGQKKTTPESFEKSLERLETIVREMEGGTLSLEKMMGHFEEGQKLVARCGTKLQEVERKIEVLVQRDGEAHAEPFENEEAASGSNPAPADAPPNAAVDDDDGMLF